MTLRRMCRRFCLLLHCWYNTLQLRACVSSVSIVCHCRVGLTLRVCGGGGGVFAGQVSMTR